MVAQQRCNWPHMGQVLGLSSRISLNMPGTCASDLGLLKVGVECGEKTCWGYLSLCLSLSLYLFLFLQNVQDPTPGITESLPKNDFTYSDDSFSLGAFLVLQCRNRHLTRGRKRTRLDIQSRGGRGERETESRGKICLFKLSNVVFDSFAYVTEVVAALPKMYTPYGLGKFGHV